jgi:hypothetical protein
MSGLADFQLQNPKLWLPRWKSSTDCLRSCRRGWNIHQFMQHNFNGRFRNASGLSKICTKTLHWWSPKSPPKNKWRRKSFENCHYRWRDVGLRLWLWNQTVLTLEESCFTSPQEIKTGALASESNAACFFFRSSRHCALWIRSWRSDI